MKKILILAAAAAVLCSCANKNKYAVDGNTLFPYTTLFRSRKSVV